jgi:hypothetical protein
MVLSCLPATIQARQWTDATGQHRCEAEFLVERDGKVWLRGADGRTLVVSSDRLSRADREYLAGLRPVASGNSAATALAARRSPRMTRTAQVPARLLHSMTSAKVAKFTGWHCSGSRFHVVDYCHQPAPLPPPAPITSTKRRYFGYFSTFHLPRRTVGQLSGTGSYKFLVGSYVVAYLEMLTFNGSIPGFSVYAVDQPGPLGITNWYFEDVAPAPSSYRVYYDAPSSGVVLYEYTTLRNPL